MPHNFDISKVETDRDLMEVAEFRYRCYLDEGLIDPRPDRRLLDDYDYAAATDIFVVRLKGTIVGTIRLHILDMVNQKSATLDAFKDILMPRITSGEVLIDAARFAVAPDIGALRLAVARQTLRLYATMAESHGVDFGVAAVQENRIEFYQRLYGFSQIAEPRAYDKLRHKLVLMGVNLKQREKLMTGTDG